MSKQMPAVRPSAAPIFLRHLHLGRSSRKQLALNRSRHAIDTVNTVRDIEVLRPLHVVTCPCICNLRQDITGDRDEDMDLEDIDDGSGGRRTAGASIMDDCDDGETEGDRGPRTGAARRRRTIASDSDDEEDEEGEEKE